MALKGFDGIALAVGTQSGGLGSINATIRDLSGSLTSSDGIVLGDRESGDAESGIAIPSFERVFRSVADLGATKQASQFTRRDVSGLAITIPMKGNGATATPAVGEAQPLAGIDALIRMAGFSGASGGADSQYDYSLAADPVYGTVHLWAGDLDWVLQDCLVTRMRTVYPPGGQALRTFELSVGSIEQANDGVTFPTLDYTTQASLAAPIVKNVAFSWSSARDFNALEIVVDNGVEETEASNQPEGILLEKGERTISASATVFVDDADSDFEYAQSGASTAPTADLTFQVGDAADQAGETINAYSVAANNAEVRSYKTTKLGSKLGAEVELVMTGASEGAEYTEQFN